MRNKESEAARWLSMGRAVSNNVTDADSVADLASGARSIIRQVGGRETLTPGKTSMDEAFCWAKSGTASNALVKTPKMVRRRKRREEKSFFTISRVPAIDL